MILGGVFACASLAGCGGSDTPATNPAADNASRERLSRDAPVERVDIEIDAKRSGHSLVVDVHGIGRGHQSGGPLEDPKAWQVSATHTQAPLKQVLAGPAKVSRAPAGAALGNQWNIDVQFMIAFALPDRAGDVEVTVRAPSGEQHSEKLQVPAPAKKLSLSVRSTER